MDEALARHKLAQPEEEEEEEMLTIDVRQGLIIRTCPNLYGGKEGMSFFNMVLNIWHKSTDLVVYYFKKMPVRGARLVSYTVTTLL